MRFRLAQRSMTLADL